MSTADNFEVGSNAVINQTHVEDVKNIIENHGSPELTYMFEELVRSYENSRLETSQSQNVVSRVSILMIFRQMK